MIDLHGRYGSRYIRYIVRLLLTTVQLRVVTVYSTYSTVQTAVVATKLYSTHSVAGYTRRHNRGSSAGALLSAVPPRAVVRCSIQL